VARVFSLKPLVAAPFSDSVAWPTPIDSDELLLPVSARRVLFFATKYIPAF